MVEQTQVLDASGLECPLPLLKAKQALNALPGGARLEVIATDPGSERDFRVFAEQSRYALERQWRDADRFHHLLHKPLETSNHP